MSRNLKSTLQVFIAIVFMFGAFGTAPARRVEAVSLDLRISQFYTSGNNGGATYQNDFIEIFNASSSPVSLLGKSIQYASAAGTGNFGSQANQITVLPDDTMPAYSYYLVKGAGGTTNGAPVSGEDFAPTTGIALGASAGKLAIVNDSVSLGCNGNATQTPCSDAQLAKIIDLVGYGTTATFFEGAAAPAPDVTESLYRGSGGCSDTDNNSIDFSKGSPTFRNSASPVNTCSSTPSVSLTTSVPANGASNVALDTNIVLTFSETVETSEGWFSLTCTLSGDHDATPAYNGTEITLDPTGNFYNNESCTLNITGSLLNPAMATDPQITFTTIESCGSYTPINAIQGSGLSSSYTGDVVTTEGVVTADYRAGNKGFYIQEPMPDTDQLTSEGMFIYTTNTSYSFAVGDRVRVKGTVDEYNGLTEMGTIQSVINCGVTPQSLMPVELGLPFADFAYPERYENMLVHFTTPLVINEYYQYDQYGEITLSSKRLDNPTNVVAPGAEAIALQAANNRDKIVLDDGSGTSNPAYLRHPDGGRFCQGTLLDTAPADCPAVHIFRGGDLVSNITAVLDYYYNSYAKANFWRLQPIGSATYQSLNLRMAAPDLVQGELRISSINTLNYFITLDNTATTPCGPLENQDCRGAISEEERLRQRAKTLAAVVGMASDITGLLELENDNPTTAALPDPSDPSGLTIIGPDYAIKDIVAGLNAAAGAGTYAYIATGPIGTDAIKAGIVYKPARVEKVGDFKLLDSTTAPNPMVFVDICNRPVLAQTFRDKATQQLFTVAVNHLKSKGSACDLTPGDTTTGVNPLDLDQGDGQSYSNYTRTQAAMAEVVWLESDPTGQGSQMYLIIGDLNSYAMEDPITAIKAGADDEVGTADDYIDLLERFRGIFSYPPSYGYVYSAQAGYLDGALANKRMASYVLDAKEWHINADEVDAIDYTFVQYKKDDQKALYQADAYRSSDHDPILISLMLNHEPAPMDDTYTAYQNRVLTIDAPGVLANDTDDNIYDKISVGSITQPTNGVVVMLPDGSFTYTPDPDFVGVDTFTYTMQATPGLMGAYETPATVTITVEFKPFDLYLPIIAK